MKERLFKLIVHVPTTHTVAVRNAIGDAGGGNAGEYTHCSFTIRGSGRFKPNDNATPHIGQNGQFEEVEEDHIEVSHIPLSMTQKVVTAMLDAHPYEETAYELIEIFKFEDLK